MLTWLKILLRSIQLKFGWHGLPLQVAQSTFGAPYTYTKTVTADAFINKASPDPLCVKGNYLLVGVTNPSKISVIDISDPSDISEVATFTHADITHPRDIFLQIDDSDVAFVTDVDAVISLDVSDVLNIAHIDTLTADASFGDPGEEFERLLKSVTSDAFIKAIQDKTVTSDAIIKAVLSKTVTSDAFISALQKVITADVFIDAFRKTVTADAYIDPIEHRLLARMPVFYGYGYHRQYARMSVVDVDTGTYSQTTIPAIMVLKEVLNKSVTADAFIKAVVSKVVTSDAFIDAIRKDVTADAFIKAVTQTVTADVFISALQKVVTADAFISAMQKSVTADTFIKRAVSHVVSNVHLYAMMMMRRR